MLSDLPNVLTILRIVAVPLLVGLVMWRTPVGDAAACLVFVIAGITDYLDGHLARARRQQSDLGRMLDPIADKLLVGASLMVLAAAQRLPWGGLYAAILILLREILVSGLREYLGGVRITLPVTRLAKWKTGLQMVAIGMLLAGDETARLLGLDGLPVALLGSVVLWAAAGATLVTGWDYLTSALRHLGAVAPRGTVAR
jgi:cardiolipin synthase (CMP-forming)